MKAISLWQPWASALFAPVHPAARDVPLKSYETRHWEPPASILGQTVAIHAAKRDTPAERGFWGDVVLSGRMSEVYIAAFVAIGIRSYHDLPRGAIVGTVTFDVCFPTDEMQDDFCKLETAIDLDWGNYSSGRFAWHATNAALFPKAIPCVGRQGFFDWSPP